MLVDGFPAGSFGTNCYVVAPRRGGECVVVDPGQDAERGLAELLDRHALRPVAVLLTHGHADHTFAVAPVCGAHDIPAYIHGGDRHLLTEPWRGMGPAGREIFGMLTLTEPDEVRDLTDGTVIEAAGLSITVTSTPGHTGGSVVFGVPAGDAPVLLSGDTLFSGSIGRTDLPGGSDAQMRDSLARVASFAEETLVYPGHGPATTIARELASNPYLRGLPAPTRGM